MNVAKFYLYREDIFELDLVLITLIKRGIESGGGLCHGGEAARGYDIAAGGSNLGRLDCGSVALVDRLVAGGLRRGFQRIAYTY